MACGPEYSDDVRGDGLLIVVDNAEETAELVAQQIQGPYGHYRYPTNQMSQHESIRYRIANPTNDTSDGSKLDNDTPDEEPRPSE